MSKIINLSAFHQAVHRVGMTAKNAAAQVLWSAAEAAMQKKSPQSPALLTRAAFKIRTVDGEGLTRSQIQYLTSRVKLIITDIHEQEKEGKRLESVLWDRCDPEMPEGDQAFKMLNIVRTKRRAFRDERLKLVEIQRNLKRLLKNG